MNRNVIIGALVVLLAAGGYYQFSYKPAQEAAMADAAAKAEADAAAAAKAAEEEVAAAAKKAEEDAAAAAAAATETATEGTAAVTDAMTAAMDPATFDPAAVATMIDGSSLDDATKTTLKAAVTAAGTDPAAITAVIAQVKTALGM